MVLATADGVAGCGVSSLIRSPISCPVSPADTDPARLRWVAETLAAEAAAFVRSRRAEVFGAATGSESRPRTGWVRSKTTPTDPVTVVDTDSERLLRDRLAQVRPGEPILGEEGGG